MDIIEFDEKEIQGRIEKCQSLIFEKGWSGIVVSNKYNIYYYSNYRTVGYEFSYTRSSFLFIPKAGKPVMFVHEFNEFDAKASCGSVCEVKKFKSLCGPKLEEIEAILRETNMFTGKVGMEYGNEQRIDFEINLLHEMEKYFSNIQFTDAAKLIWTQRMIKSKQEAACIRKACDAASYAFDHIFEKIQIGMTEAEVCRLMKMYMLEGGADDLKGVIVCIGRENYARISKAIGGNRKIEKGDFVWIDAQADYRWYSSDFCRAAVVGAISRERKETQSIIHEVTMNVIKRLRAGILASEAAEYCKEELERAGCVTSFDCGRFGHGVGLLATEPPSIITGDNTELKAGMVITIEPGIVNSEGVFDVEENILITENGYQILSGSSRELHQIEA